MSEEPDTDVNTKQLPAPSHSTQDPEATYTQPYLITPPRSEMPNLTDVEYEALKEGAGQVGTEHDQTYRDAAIDSETLRMQLGMTATGKTVSVRLIPESLTRGDVDIRGTPVWSQLSEIHYLHRELQRAGAAAALDTALFRVLDPIAQGGESNPSAISEAFMGANRSKVVQGA